MVSIRHIKPVFIFTMVLFCGIQWLSGQRSEFYQDGERGLKDGIELYQKQKYGIAQTRFQDYLNADQFKGAASPTRYATGEARYYYAACAVELFQDDALNLMEKFIQDYPESAKVPLARFQLGKLFFRNKDYKNTIIQLLATDASQLTRDQYAEYCYKLGYSYYMTADYDNALKNFAVIKDSKNLYAVAATYYYAHICYLQEKYEVALQHFLKLKDDKKFGPLVPFYIAQIYFIQKKYEDVIVFAGPIADTIKGKNTPIIRRILAESYFEVKDYPKSVANYEAYTDGGNNLNREGHYRLGLAYYFTKAYDKAALQLKDATSEEDAISQSAYYYLADCLIKTGNKRMALDALKFSFTYDHDKAITKESMFNFAKLSYELGYNPYNEAIDALNEYITRYPDATNLDEAYELLANIYLGTHNYKDALVSIAKVKVKSTNLKIAEQRIFLYRGMELFNNLEYPEAIDHFKNAIEKNYEHKIASTAKFWTGDAYYRTKDFNNAEAYFNDFLSSPSAKETEVYDDAYYNLGYCHFKKKNYSSALTEFRNFTDKAERTDRKITDAYVRIGDCYFMAKNYPKSIEYYDKSINGINPDNDYALMQKGTIQGLEGKQKEKTATLQRIANEYPNSRYMESVLYELGNSYNKLGNTNEAVRNFEKLVNGSPGGVYQSRAYLQLGLIYYNAHNNREALGWYKKVVDEYPGTVYSKTALDYIRNIYIDLGDDDGWQNYVAGLDNVLYSQSSQDSTSWQIAEKVLDSQDCGKITEAMGKYLAKYPNGFFVMQAHHYKGDCHYSLKEYEKAVPDYEYIMGQLDNEYTEDVLLRMAYIYETKYDSVKLENIYTELEKTSSNSSNLQKARVGLMRIKYQLEKYEEAVQYALAVKKVSNIDPQLLQQATFILAKSYYKINDRENAQAQFKYFETKTSSEFYPEALYHVALIQYEKGLYKDAEKTLNKSLKYMGGQKNWLARSFILLSDIYVAQGNFVEAKSLLQTVIDKHDGQDLRTLAQQKLDAILETERNNNKSNFSNDWEIDLNNNKKKEPKNENNIQN